MTQRPQRRVNEACTNETKHIGNQNDEHPIFSNCCPTPFLEAPCTWAAASSPPRVSSLPPCAASAAFNRRASRATSRSPLALAYRV